MHHYCLLKRKFGSPIFTFRCYAKSARSGTGIWYEFLRLSQGLSCLAGLSPCDTFRMTMASRSVNKVLLIGNLGRDAETKFTPSGAPVTRFSVATTRSWKDQQSNEWKEETNWTNVVLWRQENLANYLTKGKQVYVEGRLQTRSYDDKDGKKVYTTEVVADEVILLGGRGDGASGGFEGSSQAPRRGGPSSRGGAPAGGGPPEEDSGGMGVTDDDVPF
jgi:single-strand DNA-binding protein